MADSHTGPERRPQMSSTPSWRVVVPALIAICALTSWLTTCQLAEHYNDQALDAFNGTCALQKQSRPITNDRNFALAEFIDTRADSEARNLRVLDLTLKPNVTKAQYERLADPAGRMHDIAFAREVAQQFRLAFPVTKSFCADVLAGKKPPRLVQRQRSTTTGAG